jgi:hypothetical protein
MALSVSEQQELDSLLSLPSTELEKSPYRKARLQKLQAMATPVSVTAPVNDKPKNFLESSYEWAKNAGVVTGSATKQSPSTVSSLQSDAKGQSLSPIGPTAKAELEKNAPPAAPAPLSAEAQAAADKAKQDAEDKLKKSKGFNPNSIVSAMNSLADKMKDVPEEMKAELQKPGGPMDLINKSLEQFNRDYQSDQQSAKDKTEKAKNRAEWASIASMLAKNVVGYAAALNGVDPNAMAYQTTDWEKHIQGLNAELDMNLGNLRENMKMKVEGKLGEKKDLQSSMDDTFKAKMESLRTRAGMLSDQARLDQQAQLAKDEEARKAAVAQDSTTTKLESPGKELGVAMGKASNKKTFAEGIGILKTLAAQYQINPADIDAIIQKYDTGFIGLGKGNEMTPEAQNDISRLFENKYKQLTSTTSRSPSAGQPSATMVQSETVAMMKDGKQYNIPADKVEAAKSKGYTLQ